MKINNGKILSVLSSLFFILFGILRGQEKIDRGEQSSAGRTILPDAIFRDGEQIAYSFQQFDMTIIAVQGDLNFTYEPVNALPFGELVKENGFRFAINATYFAGSNTKATHCGWLKQYGNKIISEKMNDAQLRYIVQYNRRSKLIGFFPYKDFITSNDTNALEFQTGPLVVENDSVATESIRSSINGRRKASRTLLASTDNKNVYFIIARKQADLQELGNFLAKLSVFGKQKLDVINMDGGPSTAVYSLNNPELNYNIKYKLPFILGIK